jgi:nucleotide-binding universal stress UspA family protein
MEKPEANMADIRRILCPVDFSEGSRHSLEHAIVFAKWYAAEITVFHVYSAPQPLVPVATVPGNVPLLPALQPDEVTEEVRRFCQPLTPPDVGLAFAVNEGSPAKEIVRHADEISADLLIMSTHGRGGFERLILGSVTEKVLRTTLRPVLTVPPPVGTPSPGPATYKTILCPLELSEASSRALEYALSLAKEADARLILLHVVEGLTEQPYPSEAAQFNVPEYHRHLEEDAMKRLKAAVPDEDRTWCQPEERVESGKAYREILRVAADTRAELIVMGVHGKGVVDRWLFGSTTSHIVRQATCPVLTLRA